MAEFQPSLPLGEPTNLRSIEGGRAIAARDVQASFAVDADEIQTQLHNMAGYYLIAWDDEGQFNTAVHLGTRNPFAAVMLADIVHNRVSNDVAGGSGL